MKSFIKKFYLLILIIVLASILRLYELGTVPYGFANDEVSYVLSGYSIAQTNGYDIEGKFLPLSINLDSSLSPVPVYIIAIFVKLFGFSAFIARLPFALMGVGSIVLVYFIATELFKKKNIALLSSLIFALSPWHLLVTRGVWDVIPAQFFYLLGIYIFLRNIVNRRNILWSFLPFTLAFYSYHATKVFFVALLFLLFTCYRSELLKRKKQTLAYLLLVGLLIISFFLVMKTQSVSRQEELLINNENFLKEAKRYVDFHRDKSSAPEILKKIESNKIEFTMNKIISTYVGAFSPNHLFFVGDINPIVGYGTFFKGVLYLVDLPFLLFGVLFLFANALHIKAREKSVVFKLLIGFVLIAPIPSALGAGTTYIIRAFMMVPFMSIVIAYGIYNFFTVFRFKKGLRYFLVLAIIIIYVVFLTRFIYQYYYQFNYFGGEFWNRSSRELSEYIKEKKNSYDTVIIGQATDRLFLQYSLFSESDAGVISYAWINKWPAEIGNVKFEDTCFSASELESLKGRVLYIASQACEDIDSARHQIVDHMEPLRVLWNIYE